MAYIAAVLLMHLKEEDAFWAFLCLLDSPKYFQDFFSERLAKVQKVGVFCVFCSTSISLFHSSMYSFFSLYLCMCLLFSDVPFSAGGICVCWRPRAQEQHRCHAPAQTWRASPHVCHTLVRVQYCAIVRTWLRMTHTLDIVSLYHD